MHWRGRVGAVRAGPEQQCSDSPAAPHQHYAARWQLGVKRTYMQPCSTPSLFPSSIQPRLPDPTVREKLTFFNYIPAENYSPRCSSVRKTSFSSMMCGCRSRTAKGRRNGMLRALLVRTGTSLKEAAPLQTAGVFPKGEPYRAGSAPKTHPSSCAPQQTAWLCRLPAAVHQVPPTCIKKLVPITKLTLVGDLPLHILVDLQRSTAQSRA